MHCTGNKIFALPLPHLKNKKFKEKPFVIKHIRYTTKKEHNDLC